MPRLSVNINKIATLRNTRRSEIPSIVRLAAHALDAGAHGITVHRVRINATFAHVTWMRWPNC